MNCIEFDKIGYELSDVESFFFLEE